MINAVGISPIAATRPLKGSDRPDQPTVSPKSASQSNAGLKPQNLGGANALFAQEAQNAPKAVNKADGELSDGEKRRVAELKKRDAEVKAHEAAHRAAGGQFAGAASYGYEQGPDGKRYATSGEVPLTIKVDPKNHDATLQNLRTVKRAALAPSRPSSADLRIAANAESKMAQVRAEKAKEAREEFGDSSGINSDKYASAQYTNKA